MEKPRIPMSPGELPRQRSPGETLLPPRPEGFVGHCDYYERMPDDVRPKGSPRKVEYLGAAEWAETPMHCRVDAYYLNPRGRYWLLWNYWQDENSAGWPWRWSLFAWGLRKGVSWEQAAVYLLMDAWRAEGGRRFAFISDPGNLSAVGLNAIADCVWPPKKKPAGR